MRKKLGYFLKNVLLKSMLVCFLFTLFYHTACRDGFKEDDVMVAFNFNGKSLAELVQAIADIKQINILMPNEFHQNTTIKINFNIPDEVPLQELEEYLLYFLSMAGYTLSMNENVFLVTKKTASTIGRNKTAVYVNIDPHDLPDNNADITAIYFLKHIKVPLESNDPLKNILFDMIPNADKCCMVDPRSNAIIITSAPANAIATAMTVILKIDEFGISDEVVILPLVHTSVNVIGPVLEELLQIARESNPKQLSNSWEYGGASYFSPQTKIVRDVRNNSLIILGKHDAIEKLINFVKTELDIASGEGQSVIHIYNLKYLNAKKIGPILQNLVNGKQQSGQSIKESGASTLYRVFDGVRILAEKTTRAEQGDSTGKQQEQSGIILGGNRLIIAAKQDDYNEIKEILDKLDKPQPQVIIETMFLDLEVDEFGNFSSQTRLPSIFNLPKGTALQAIMIDGSQVVIGDHSKADNGGAVDTSSTSANASINADLLKGLQNSNGTTGDQTNSANTTSILDMTTNRGIVISLAEQFAHASISSILNLEEGFSKKNVIANPYGITQNNENLVMKQILVRCEKGGLNESVNTQQTVIKIQKYEAVLGISITPRINFGSLGVSDLDHAKKRPVLNLEIQLQVEEFSSPNSKDVNKFIRKIKTSTNVASGDLLVLGGLYKHSFGKKIVKTPILGDIPLIGAFFRGTKNNTQKSNLIMIVRATVINDDLMAMFSSNKLQKYTGWDEDIALGVLDKKVTEFNLNAIEKKHKRKVSSFRNNTRESYDTILAKDIIGKGDVEEVFFTSCDNTLNDSKQKNVNDKKSSADQKQFIDNFDDADRLKQIQEEHTNKMNQISNLYNPEKKIISN